MRSGVGKKMGTLKIRRCLALCFGLIPISTKSIRPPLQGPQATFNDVRKNCTHVHLTTHMSRRAGFRESERRARASGAAHPVASVRAACWLMKATVRSTSAAKGVRSARGIPHWPWPWRGL